MPFVLISFVAGALSVLAPCVIVMIPLLLARNADGERSRNPYFVILGLAISVFIFSILLKSSTLLIDVPTQTWRVISGFIVIAFGLTYVFPSLWEVISGKLHLAEKANKQSGKALQKTGTWADFVLGASLGPVFGACSPTYALIVATILPATPATGVIYLSVFVLGLVTMLGIITIFGAKAIKKLGWGINPKGWFKRTLGIIFIVLGLMLATGFDKTVQTWAVSHGLFDWQVSLESNLQQ